MSEFEELQKSIASHLGDAETEAAIAAQNAYNAANPPKWSIEVFPQEIADGLEHIVKTSGRVNLVAPAVPYGGRNGFEISAGGKFLFVEGRLFDKLWQLAHPGALPAYSTNKRKLTVATATKMASFCNDTLSNLKTFLTSISEDATYRLTYVPKFDEKPK